MDRDLMSTRASMILRILPLIKFINEVPAKVEEAFISGTPWRGLQCTLDSKHVYQGCAGTKSSLTACKKRWTSN